MPRNNPNITIEFKAKGQKPLLDALKKLNEQQKKLANNVKNTGSAVKGFNLRVQKATKTAKEKGRIVDKLNASIAVYRNRILLAAFATGLFAKTVGKLMSLYGEQELAERKLSNALGLRSKALLDFAAAQQQATSYGDELTISAMSQMAAFTKNEEAIKQATIIATDFSAKTGKTMEESMKMITSSVFGTRNAFKTFGVEMSNASKPTERFNSLMQGLNTVYGGEAQQQMSTYASKVRAMSGAMGDLGEVIGEDFVELLTGLIRGVTKAAEVFGKLTNSSFNLAGVMVSLGLGAFVAIKRFKVLSAIIVLTKGAMAGAAITTKRMTVAIKSLAKSTILIAGLQLVMEGIAKVFGKTERTITVTADKTQRIVLDMADLNHEISRLDKNTTKLRLEQVFERVRDAIIAFDVTEETTQFASNAEGLAAAIGYVAGSITQRGNLLQWGKEATDMFSDLDGSMTFLKEKPIAELEGFVNDIRTTMSQSRQPITDFDRDFLRLLETLILLRKQNDKIRFSQSDWLDDLPDKLKNTNNQLIAKLGYMNDEEKLAEALIEIEASRRFVYGSEEWEKEKDVIFEKLQLQIRLNNALRDQQSAQQTAISQTSQLANAMTSMIFPVDVASLTWEKFGQTVISVLNRIVAKFIAEMGVFLLFSRVLGVQGMTAPSIFGWSPFAATTTSGVGDLPMATQFHSGGMVPQSYHSGGNVPIIAQEGEFVMRRSAVESIGVENLNRMNRTGQTGGVNVTFSGNVMSNDFIEDVAIPKIKDAIRRGADIGIS